MSADVEQLEWLAQAMGQCWGTPTSDQGCEAAVALLEYAKIARVLERVGDDELIVWQSVEDGDDGPHNPDYLAEIEGEYGKGDTPLAALLALADALDAS